MLVCNSDIVLNNKEINTCEEGNFSYGIYRTVPFTNSELTLEHTGDITDCIPYNTAFKSVWLLFVSPTTILADFYKEKTISQKKQWQVNIFPHRSNISLQKKLLPTVIDIEQLYHFADEKSRGWLKFEPWDKPGQVHVIQKTCGGQLRWLNTQSNPLINIWLFTGVIEHCYYTYGEIGTGFAIVNDTHILYVNGERYNGITTGNIQDITHAVNIDPYWIHNNIQPGQRHWVNGLPRGGVYNDVRYNTNGEIMHLCSERGVLFIHGKPIISEYFQFEDTLFHNSKKYTGVYNKCIYVNGKLYTGIKNGIFYSQGVCASGFQAHGEVLFKDGKRYTGEHEQQMYLRGKLYTGPMNGIFYCQGVCVSGFQAHGDLLFQNGKNYNGIYDIDNALYKHGKKANGVVKYKNQRTLYINGFKSQGYQVYNDLTFKDGYLFTGVNDQDCFYKDGLVFTGLNQRTLYIDGFKPPGYQVYNDLTFKDGLVFTGSDDQDCSYKNGEKVAGASGTLFLNGKIENSGDIICVYFQNGMPFTGIHNNIQYKKGITTN